MTLRILAPNIKSDLKKVCDLNDIRRAAKRTDSDISGYHFCDCVLESEDMSYLSFINCTFENCIFSECDFEKTSFVDVRFISTDFSNAKMNSAYFSRCEIRSSKLLGVDLIDCVLQNLVIESSNCSYAIFDSSKISSTCFKSSDFSGAEIVSSSLKAFTTSGCKYVGTSFFRTALGGVDFSDSIISGLKVSDTFRELRNAIFAPSQAVELSLLLGITIK